jgi:hypothetical protein
VEDALDLLVDEVDSELDERLVEIESLTARLAALEGRPEA